MTKEKADWVKMKPEEFEKIVVDLAKKGDPPEKIGIILRDKYGIPKSSVFGKTMGKIIRAAGIEVNSEYKNINSKLELLRKHLDKNKHDYTAKRSLIKNTSRINKFKKV